MTEALIEELEAQAERALRDLGDLEPQVIGAVTPQRLGDALVAWPWRVLGRLRMVRRQSGVLFVTEGLSYPFDPSVHGPDRDPLGFEIGIEIANPKNLSTAELSRAWVTPVLLWLSAVYLTDEFPLLELIDQFGMVTQLLPPDPALQNLILPDGNVGALAGMPLTPGEPFGLDAQTLLAEVDEHESRLIVLTAISPDEYAFACSVNDGSRAQEVANALWAGGTGHLTVPTRCPSR
jgi:hypothetical protein